MRTIAPAKINWTLEVLCRRADGYHEVRSVMQTIDLCDELEAHAADSLTLEVNGPQEPPGDDLVIRAARSLAEETQRESAVAIVLRKRIPVGAGLGGGSSDAAATLRLLNQYWDLGLTVEELSDLGARLGSDVPFFLRGGTALVEGRGERVTPLLDTPQTWLVAVVRAHQMMEKTKRMYQSLTPADFSDGSHSGALTEAIRSGRAPDDSILYNAFERVAYVKVEGLSHYRDALLAAGARSVHVAGSGPALFALTDGEPEAGEIRNRIGAMDGDRFAVRTLNRTEATVVQD